MNRSRTALPGFLLATALLGPAQAEEGKPWDWPMGLLPPLAEDFHTICAWPARDEKWQARRASGDYKVVGDPAAPSKRMTRTVDGVNWTLEIEAKMVPASDRSPALKIISCTLMGADPDDLSRKAIEAWAGRAQRSADGVTRIGFSLDRVHYKPVPFDANDDMAKRQILEIRPTREIELFRVGGMSVFRSIHTERAPHDR